MSAYFEEVLKEKFDGKRYYPISSYLKKYFGEKTIKLAIDGGFTCPNRDGSKGFGGCIFCSDTGSGEFSSHIEDQIELYKKKWPRAKYLAYFQNHTNTYASPTELREKYYQILEHKEIEGLVIGTRPDCLDNEILDLLEEINKKYFLWVELGLQTIHDETAKLINRCYDYEVFEKAISDLEKRKIKTVVHLILGLPGENREMMLESVKTVGSIKNLFGIKLHMLNVVKGSVLEKLYPNYCSFSSIEEYVDLVTECIQLIPDTITIHRLTADVPRPLLISPIWSFNKRTILNSIDQKLNLLDTYQGKLLG